MSNSDIDTQLLLFRRQYLQLFEPDFLAWPPPQLLRSSDAQTWLHKNLFDESRNPRLPPARYQLRVLQPLVTRIEKAIHHAGEGELCDDLKARLASLSTHGFPSESLAVQENAYVTFTCLPEHRVSSEENDDAADDPTVTLLEHRSLVQGSKVTGYRTWEAALHLGAYLLTEAGARLVAGKSVLELGAGTGFLAVLCAKHLQARHVTTTDGDAGVVHCLRHNLRLNGLDDGRRVKEAKRLWWGEELRGMWVEEACECEGYDVVVGADITYEKGAVMTLALTLQHLFDLRPRLVVIIAGVVRNATFQAFRDECVRRDFLVEEVQFGVKPMREQKCLFYAAAMPIKILKITRPA
ncbi:Uu.00g065040.m01.CDS01 [Anthostomella pinea]|uniref:Uu.00g065040.m01.CDS01 n=1 Tax=Anthostomella pinea TaxID=933095 RepID=A0AAI8YN15_9PEZI|nr:Uu.00g065040.m01.CDS01 [Anthostomella pinea]